MNILLITPGINKKYNDNYFVYDSMAKQGNKILAISQREHINKGKGTQISPEFEISGSIIIHRLFDTWKEQKSIISRIFKYPKIRNILSDFKPDVIICEELTNMPLAKKIKRNFNIPIVLRVEFAYNKEYPYRTMAVALNKFKNKLTKDYLPILIGESVWNWASKNSDVIISCFFGDASRKDFNNAPPLHYVPWPTFLPTNLPRSEKIKERAIFVGAFQKHKNIKELEITIPLLLNKTPIKEIYIVGMGEDLNIVENLKAKYPNNIKHMSSLSRIECLALIRSSFLSYSPATMGGWGFIGDSFAMKTPIVVTHNHYGFNDGIDSVLTTKNQIVNRINDLYDSEELYNKISLGGYTRFIENHTSEAIGLRFSQICFDTIKNKK